MPLVKPLCRLCERPTADGAIQAVQLDKEKLQTWLLNVCGHEMAEEVQDEDLICYYCMWHAEFHAKYVSEFEALAWWPPNLVYLDDEAKELRRMYLEGKTEQCWVQLEKIELPKSENDVNAEHVEKSDGRKGGKKCFYCGQIVVKISRHVRKMHANAIRRDERMEPILKPATAFQLKMGETLIPLSANYPKVNWLSIRYQAMDKLADYAIKVVSKDQTVTEVKAFHSDLTIGSKRLLELAYPISGKPKKVLIVKDIDADVLKLALEFIHLNGNLLSEVDSLDACVQLAVAADRFEIIGLEQFSAKLLMNKFLSPENVWNVLNSHHKSFVISTTCLKFLSLNTKECLQNGSFRDLEEEPFRLFLSLRDMADISEFELVSASLQISEKKTDPRTFFRNCCLPKLRLLALNADDFSKLPRFFSYLTREEQEYLAFYSASPSQRCFIVLPPSPKTFCPNTTKRSTKRARTLDLVPEHKIQSSKVIFREGNWFEPKQGSLEFSLELRSKKSIKLTGFEIFCELDLEKEFREEIREAEKYPCNLEGECSVSVFEKRFCRKIQFPAKLEKDGWVFVEHCMTVPAGGRITLRLRLERPRFLRTLLASPDFHEHENTFFEPPKISVETEEGDLTNNYCILKKISYVEL
ncbi:Hypothetical predicted protein [Cloeon dipterum]|uniref:BTB domain-containing protein n=1 Tax=Cloeon dipterum TaxID=197152 RepID=A0A8S1DYX1_9INSE|nr:Hypothetical predicted protein [Cloeon dipterum]